MEEPMEVSTTSPWLEAEQQVAEMNEPDSMEESSQKPRWLTREYFQWLISQKYPQAKITSTNTSKRVQKGLDPTCSVYAYIELLSNARLEMISYIVKSPGLGVLVDIDKAEIDMIETEARVITKIIPIMERILEKAVPGKYVPLTSPLVDHEDRKIHYNVIENDCFSDFEVVAQKEGLDLKYSLAVVRHLAIFHAASIPALKEVSQEILEMPLLPDSDAWDITLKAIKTSISGIMSHLRTWEDGERYMEKLRRLQEILPKEYAKAHRRRPGAFQVLVHGAPCEDRILFRHGDDRLVQGVRLRGFENSRVGSFADDVLRFIYEATSNDVLECHTDLLVEEYRCAFNDALEMLGIEDKIISPETMRQELEMQKAVALVAAFHGLPHTRMPGYLSFWFVDEIHTIVFENPEYSRMLRLLLPRFLAKGWLDGFMKHRICTQQTSPSNEEWRETIDAKLPSEQSSSLIHASTSSNTSFHVPPKKVKLNT